MLDVANMQSSTSNAYRDMYNGDVISDSEDEISDEEDIEEEPIADTEAELHLLRLSDVIAWMKQTQISPTSPACMGSSTAASALLPPPSAAAASPVVSMPPPPAGARAIAPDAPQAPPATNGANLTGPHPDDAAGGGLDSGDAAMAADVNFEDEGDPAQEQLAEEEEPTDEEEDVAPNISCSSSLEELYQSARQTDAVSSPEFIQMIQEATLDSEAALLGPKVIERLQDPLRTAAQLSPDEQLSIELFLACNSAAQEVYNSSRKAILRRHPDNNVLTLEEVKALLVEITGVVDVCQDMCIDSCAAFTGPLSDRTTCHICGKDRLDPTTSKPQQQFNSIPLGPQLQALKRDLGSAIATNYLQEHSNQLVAELNRNNGVLASFDDILCGSQFAQAFEEGLIGYDDFVVMLSFDGAQLFKMKASDCWIGVWIIANHSPEGRYKIVAVLPAFTAPGPNKPKHMDSYFYTSFHHLSALQKDGFKLWDASKDEIVTSRPFFALGMADGPALTHLNGLVRHMGYNGCRMCCGLRGPRKGNNKHYYPALMRPTDAPDDHTDADALAVSQTAPPSTEQYLQDLKTVIEATSERAYWLARKQTGIVKPSILLGIDSKHRFPITSCWGPDIMHLLCLNIPDLLIPLWQGESHMVHRPDSVQTWAFAVYADDDRWQQHGALVAAATPFLPASFDCPPRNPCEKLHSGYKAWEHMGIFIFLGQASSTLIFLSHTLTTSAILFVVFI
ncbi:hypothetical protein DXG01_010986 [Tephrocybe rancida]|nr:hypothetical protein DXG01_010986 [Tephrocybe rancida]